MTNPANQTPQDAFRQMLDYVIGRAFTAGGYSLQENTMQRAHGMFRYEKSLESGLTGVIEFQMLRYPNGPSRFRISLLRRSGPETVVDNITLTRLLWDTFKVQTLPDPDHWWPFKTPHEMGYALAEAGKLLFGFGIPWLEGRLTGEGASGA